MRSRCEHPKCYAKALGGCSSQIDREHYFTKSILNYLESLSTVMFVSRNVRNLNIPHENLQSRFKAKILCVKHHRMLNTLDDEALRFFKACRLTGETLSKQSGSDVMQSHINGDRLERWCLKTLCGFARSGTILAGEDKLKVADLPLNWLRPLFGLSQLTDGRGLYYRVKPGLPLDKGLDLSITLIANDYNKLCGAEMELAGFAFILAMAMPHPHNPGEHLNNAVFHPQRFEFRTGESHTKAVIKFSWDNTDEVGAAE
jgi:hypothetical protein